MGIQSIPVKDKWLKLRCLSAAVKAGDPVSAETLRWIADAIDATSGNDPKDLIRSLGLYVHGRHRKFDTDSVRAEVAALIAAGSSIMTACERVADAHGCSVKTVYRWFQYNKGA